MHINTNHHPTLNQKKPHSGIGIDRSLPDLEKKQETLLPYKRRLIDAVILVHGFSTA